MWHRSIFALEQNIFDNEYLQNLHTAAEHISNDPVAISSLDDSKSSDFDCVDEEQYVSATLHYFTLLYTTLHYFTLLYTTLHYFTLLYTTLHYFTLL